MKVVFQDESRVFDHSVDDLYLHQFTTGDLMSLSPSRFSLTKKINEIKLIFAVFGNGSILSSC